MRDDIDSWSRPRLAERLKVVGLRAHVAGDARPQLTRRGDDDGEEHHGGEERPGAAWARSSFRYRHGHGMGMGFFVVSGLEGGPPRITQTNCFAPQPPNAAAVLSERPVSVRQRLSDGRRECVVCRRSQSCLSRGGERRRGDSLSLGTSRAVGLALASAGHVVDLALASALAGGHAGHAQAPRGAEPT